MASVGGANSFTLQPVSVEGQIGLNVVATVTGLEFNPVVPVRHYRQHRRYNQLDISRHRDERISDRMATRLGGLIFARKKQECFSDPDVRFGH